MLQKLPAGVGRALASVRAGLDRVAINDERFANVESALSITSREFIDGDPLPIACTADGAGRSPALTWDAEPSGATSLVLLVEDADSPSPQPLVHAIAWDLPVFEKGLSAGSLGPPASASPVPLGKNSFLRAGWLAPDPPPGHGAHRYVFQLFALDTMLDLGENPGRGAVLDAMAGHVVAIGFIVGTDART